MLRNFNDQDSAKVGKIEAKLAYKVAEILGRPRNKDQMVWNNSRAELIEHYMILHWAWITDIVSKLDVEYLLGALQIYDDLDFWW